jgi:hypothetical protein
MTDEDKSAWMSQFFDDIKRIAESEMAPPWSEKDSDGTVSDKDFTKMHVEEGKAAHASERKEADAKLVAFALSTGRGTKRPATLDFESIDVDEFEEDIKPETEAPLDPLNGYAYNRMTAALGKGSKSKQKKYLMPGNNFKPPAAKHDRAVNKFPEGAIPVADVNTPPPPTPPAPTTDQQVGKLMPLLMEHLMTRPAAPTPAPPPPPPTSWFSACQMPMHPDGLTPLEQLDWYKTMASFQRRPLSSP